MVGREEGCTRSDSAPVVVFVGSLYPLPSACVHSRFYSRTGCEPCVLSSLS